MKTNPQKETRLIDGYLRGNLSKKEESMLADWIGSSDKNYQAFKKHIAENQFYQIHSEGTVLAWEKLKSKITRSRSIKENKKFVLPNWAKVAAIIVVALLSGFFANQIIRDTHYNSAFNEVIIPNGEKAQIVLSDGTKVFLNAGTHLKYPTVFSNKSRKVIISGEAFFEVAKDKAHPFIIETPEFDVEVTGTSFNLSTYPEDVLNSLTLHTGEVTIFRAGQIYEISPGEKYTLDTKIEKSNIVKADLQKSYLWTEGVIVIDNLNLEAIRKILERKFNVQIKINDEKYNNIRYSGQFKPHETLEEVLDLIQETSPLKFSYKINETKNEIIIK
jgi:ferric-dicitrate binding protein FerR (iron transport regulator)